MELQAAIEKYGLVGAIVIGMYVLVHKLVVWMQSRIDAKDGQLQEQHAKQLEMSQAVISLASDTATKTAQALDALTSEIKAMGVGICERIERIEGRAKVE